jgi:glucans biosynthesis protein C
MVPGETAVSVLQATPAPILAADRAGNRSAARLAYIDNVRASMIVLVLGMHAAVTYSPFGSWYMREHPPLTQAETLFFLTFQAFLQGFFMALLFFVAGCFTPNAYDRKGPARFLADRLYRLGLPTLLYVLLIGPMTEYYLAGSWRSRASFLEAMEAYVVSGRVFSGTGPLWFCVALLIFSTIYALWRMSTAFPAGGRDLTYRQIGLTVLAMAAATFLTKTLIPGGRAVLNLQLADFPSYIIMFAAGATAGRSGWLHKTPTRFAVTVAAWCLGAGIVGWWPLLSLGGAFSGHAAAYGFGWTWQNAAASLWAALVCVGGSAGVLILFRAVAASQGALARFLSANAFAVYVTHPPVLVALTLALRPLSSGPLEKFVLLWALGVVLTFGIAAPAVRCLPGMRSILR